jgi:hypothetical protein
MRPYRYFTSEARVRRERPLDDAALSGFEMDHALRLSLGLGSDEPLSAAARDTKELVLRGCIADLTALAAFSKLESLSLETPFSVDLSPLTELTKLRRLSLSRIVDLDLSPVAAFGGLRELELKDCGVTELLALTRRTELTELTIVNCPVKSVFPLGRHHALTRLFLRYTSVVNLEPLAGLKALAVLDVMGSPVKSAAVAARLPNLQSFNVSRTNVTSTDDVSAKQHTVRGLDSPARHPAYTPPSSPWRELLSEWHTRRASKDRDHAAERKLERALVASRDSEAIEAVLLARTRDDFPSPWKLRGLVVAPGTPLVAFSPNPWGIAANASLDDALAAVWGPLQRRCPRFLAGLRRSLVGMASLEDEHGSHALAYLVMRLDDANIVRIDDLPPRPDNANPIDTWPEGSTVGLLGGGAPIEPVSHTLGGSPLPLVLAELGRAHGKVYGSSFSVETTHDERLQIREERVADFRGRNRGAEPDRYAIIGSDLSGDTHVLDLDRLDAHGDPFLARWDHETWAVGAPTPFWTWFEEEACRSFFGFFAWVP